MVCKIFLCYIHNTNSYNFFYCINQTIHKQNKFYQIRCHIFDVYTSCQVTWLGNPLRAHHRIANFSSELISTSITVTELLTSLVNQLTLPLLNCSTYILHHQTFLQPDSHRKINRHIFITKSRSNWLDAPRCMFWPLSDRCPETAWPKPPWQQRQPTASVRKWSADLIGTPQAASTAW